MMYNPIIEIVKDDYIITSTGNIISRQAVISKPQALEIPGGRCFIDHHVHLHTDIAPIQLQRYVYISIHSVLKPSQTWTEPIRHIPMTVGTNTYIGPHCVIEAAAIGVGCHIGDHVIIAKRCILKDHVRVLDHTVIPADMVIPPFSIVAGNPAEIIGEESESVTTLASMKAVDRYKAITPVSTAELQESSSSSS